MSHMVIYRGADGKPGYHQTDDIHDAVMYVESLRNDKDVDHARIFRLEEVTFEYRPYYRVELAGAGAAVGSAGAATAGAVGNPVISAPTNGSSNGNDSGTDTDTDSDDDDDAVLETSEVDAGDLDDDIEDAADDVADDSDDDDDDDDDAEDSTPATGARRGLFGR